MKPETVTDSETVRKRQRQGRRPAEKRPSDTQTETVKRSEL